MIGAASLAVTTPYRTKKPVTPRTAKPHADMLHAVALLCR
jgi:hypothetical protein